MTRKILKGKKLVSSTFILLMVISTSVFAEQYNLLYRPIEYDKIVDEISVTDEGKEQGNVIWVVLSDRANNTTYASPRGVKPVGHLDFLEACYVNEESNAWVHVVQDNEISASPPATSSQVIDRGWIQKRHLVLSPYSIITQNQIPRKALIMFSPHTLNNRRSKGENVELPTVYSGPGEKYSPLLRNNHSNFYFIYNTDRQIGQSAHWYLLAKFPQLFSSQNLLETSQNAQERFIGWIKADHIAEWNTRVATEINWDWKSIKERQEQHIKPVLFSSNELAAAQNYARRNMNSLNINQENILNILDDPYTGTYPLDGSPKCLKKIENLRPDPQEFRMPLIKVSLGENLCTVVVQDQNFTSFNNDTISSSEYYQLHQVCSDLKKSITNINYYFIIGWQRGTSSKYLNTIIRAIKYYYRYISNNSIRTKFYLTYFDDNSLQPNKITIDQINYSSIDSIAKDIISKDIGISSTHSVLSLLRNGIKNIVLTKNEINVAILLGDKSIYSDNLSLPNNFIEKISNYYAIQINTFGRSNNALFENFISQNLSFADMSQQKLSGKILDTRLWNSTPKIQELGYQSYSSNGIVNFKVEGLPKGRILGQYGFEWKLTSIFKKVQTLVYHRYQVLSGLQGLGTEIPPDAYLSSRLLDEGITPNLLNKFPGHFLRRTEKGLISLSNSNTKFPIFKSVILISQDHLAALVEALKPLATSQDRNELQTAWRNYIRFMIGDISANQMDEWLKNDMARISELGFGIPTNSRFSHVNYFDLADMSEGNKRELISYLGNKADRLEKKLYDDNARFQIDEIKYYWVSEDKLP